MELVLYYGTNDPGMKKHEMMMKSVLVRMGVKIRNVKPEQVMETIGCLAGMPGFQEQENASAPLPVIPEQMLNRVVGKDNEFGIVFLVFPISGEIHKTAMT